MRCASSKPARRTSQAPRRVPAQPPARRFPRHHPEPRCVWNRPRKTMVTVKLVLTQNIVSESTRTPSWRIRGSSRDVSRGILEQSGQKCSFWVSGPEENPKSVQFFKKKRHQCSFLFRNSTQLFFSTTLWTSDQRCGRRCFCKMFQGRLLRSHGVSPVVAKQLTFWVFNSLGWQCFGEVRRHKNPRKFQKTTECRLAGLHQEC